MSGPQAGSAAIEIGAVAKPPFVRLPDLAAVFQSRAARLEALASGHPLADYLSFIGQLARAQDAALRAMPPGSLPGPAEIASAQAARQAPLDPRHWRRDAAWLAALDQLLARMGEAELPAPAQAALAQLAGLEQRHREALADRVLRGQTSALDAAASCFVWAALQVHWTRMAALLDPADLRPLADPCACPACAAAAAWSLVHAASGLHNTRSLACALCATEWHHVRIKCAHCASTKGIAYHHVAELGAGIKAETCDECRTYTKIFYLTQDPALDPPADDLASLALDVLVSEAGWDRAVPNPFLLPGGDDSAPG